MSTLDNILDDADPAEVFDILERLGEGSYGEVYSAIDRRTGKSVALKVIPIEGSEGELLTLRREIDILKRCSSLYVVQYMGSYRRDGDLWIAMELCTAGSLVDIMAIAEITLLEEELSEVAAAVLLGLRYLHDDVRVIHRDLKAGNVLVTEDGGCKLADFGVSAQLSATISRRKTTIGTPFWLSPEIIQGEAEGSSGYDCRADIWALGITMIELADGAPPYADKVHPLRALFLIPTRDPPTVADPSAWSPTFNDFVKCCLRKKFEERPFAKDLLQHPFVAASAARIQAANGKSALIAELVQKCMPLIEEARREENNSTEDSAADHDAERASRQRPEGKFSDDQDEDAAPTGTMVVSGDDHEVKGDEGAEETEPMSGTMVVNNTPAGTMVARDRLPAPGSSVKPSSSTMRSGTSVGKKATGVPASRTMKPSGTLRGPIVGGTLRGPLKAQQHVPIEGQERSRFQLGSEESDSEDFKSAHAPNISGVETAGDDSLSGSFGSAIPAFRGLGAAPTGAAIGVTSATGVGAIGSIYSSDAGSIRQLTREALGARLEALDAAFRVDMAELTSKYDKARKVIEEALALPQC